MGSSTPPRGRTTARQTPAFCLRARTADFESASPTRTTAGKRTKPEKSPARHAKARQPVKNLAKTACGQSAQPNQPARPRQSGENAKKRNDNAKNRLCGQAAPAQTPSPFSGAMLQPPNRHRNGKRQSQKTTAGEPPQSRQPASEPGRAGTAGKPSQPKNPKAKAQNGGQDSRSTDHDFKVLFSK